MIDTPTRPGALTPDSLLGIRALALWQPNGLNGRNRTLGPRGNDGDRAQWAKQGAVVGAALCFFKRHLPRRKKQLSARGGPTCGACQANPGGGLSRSRFPLRAPTGGGATGPRGNI